MWSPLCDDDRPRPEAPVGARRFTEFDLVVLTADRPELGLRAGDVGTVVSVRGTRCHVEFATPGGACPGVLTARADALRAVAPDEVFHVRTVDAPVRTLPDRSRSDGRS